MEAKKHDCAQGEEIQNSQYGSNQCWWVIEFSPNFQSSYQLGYYTCTLDNSTLVILFSKMLKISKITSFESQNIVKNISFVEMKISKLTKCLMNICWTDHARYYDNSLSAGSRLFW
jgi:hypothetical protein